MPMRGYARKDEVFVSATNYVAIPRPPSRSATDGGWGSSGRLG
jgi:hypothetical protein